MPSGQGSRDPDWLMVVKHHGGRHFTQTAGLARLPHDYFVHRNIRPGPGVFPRVAETPGNSARVCVPPTGRGRHKCCSRDHDAADRYSHFADERLLILRSRQRSGRRGSGSCSRFSSRLLVQSRPSPSRHDHHDRSENAGLVRKTLIQALPK